MPHPAPPPGARVAVGLGTNLGDRHGHLRRAVAALGGVLDALRCSTVWASDAMLLPGAPPGWAIPFLNAVVVGRTRLEPEALLDRLQGIERRHGRGPHEKWAPRPLDLDLLLYGDRALETPRLTVPHPGLLERPFVLLPLAELLPAHRVPGEARPLSALAADYRARHGEALPFHAHPVTDAPPLAAGA